MRSALVSLCAVVFLGCGESTPETAPPGPGSQDAGDGASADAPDTSAPDTSAPDTAEGAPPDTGGPDALDAKAEEAAPPGCGTGDRPVPTGLVELKWDDGTAKSNLRKQTWSIEVNGTKYVLADQILHEAVRFDLEHPARVHGFSVQWTGLPGDAGPSAEIAAGLFPDFGHNGFDFWQWKPLWSGTRCVKDIKEGAWVDYVFDKPIEVPHPGLVYVAHRIDGPSSPVFPFDGTQNGDGKCEKFAECHSAMNMPEVEKSQFFNGVSFSFQYDYLVRLHVEYTEQIKPEDRIFQPQAFQPKSHVSFGDYDDDGWDDVVTEGPTLYRNQGDGTFADVTASSGIAAMKISGSGGVWGDYDNDGCLDLFVYAESYTQADSLLHSNCNGTFTDVTAGSGVVDQQSYNDCGNPANVRSPSAAAAWIDLDADGLLDLYVANFICWEKETYYSDTVFHNLGKGKFEDWSGQHGFSALKTASRGASPVDHDGDGDVDLLVNNYRLQANLFFDNNGNGTVTEKADALGLAGEMHGFGVRV
jgi:hypothetical protein